VPVVVAASEPLRLLPQEAALVGGASVEAFRKTAVWTKLIEARDADPKEKAEYEDFKTRTGWDPWATLFAVHFAAAGDVETSKEFALVMTTTAPVDEKKLVAYLEAKAKENKSAVLTSQYQGKTLYGVREKGVDGKLAFLDDKTIVLAGPKWAEKIVGLSAGTGAGVDKNPKMMAVVARANRAAFLWLAGDLPPSMGTTPLGVTVKSLVAAMDFPASGFKLDVTTTTASPDEGKKLSELATQQLAQLQPMAQALGLTAVLASLKVQQSASDVSFGVNLTAAQVDELVQKGQQMAAGAKADGAGKAGKKGAGKAKTRRKRS